MSNLKTFQNMKMLSALQNANSILLCTHIAPDGDALGSLLAMGIALQGMGKQVCMACTDAVPEKYHFLPCWDQIVGPSDLENRAFDAALALDIASEARLGDCEDAFFATPVTMQIDHHGTNPGYAQHNEVDGQASAAGCMVWRCLKALAQPITPEIATCLYAAISSDTGNFCFDNTNEEAFLCMGDLMAAGLRINKFARTLHLVREREHVLLLGRALQTLRVLCDGKLTTMQLTQADYRACAAQEEHNAKIVNYGIDISGVKMTYLADEQDGYTRFSLRSQLPCDVAVIAQMFGGGGHVQASGCRIDLPLKEACRLVEEQMIQQIKERLS